MNRLFKKYSTLTISRFVRQSGDYFKYCTLSLWLNCSCRCSARVWQRKYDKTKRTEREKKKRENEILPISALFLNVNWQDDRLQWKWVVRWPRYRQYPVPQSSAPRNRRKPSRWIALSFLNIFSLFYWRYASYNIIIRWPRYRQTLRYATERRKPYSSISQDACNCTFLTAFNFGYECASDLISFPVDQKYEIINEIDKNLANHGR